MSEKLRKEFIELLEKDVEFRYTVAGYLGLSEILKRLDRHESHIVEILKRIEKIEERMLALEERMLKLEENQNKLWENQGKLWEEVKALMEGQNKLWEGQNKLWEEVRRLSEGQNRLWESQNRLWEEVKALRTEHERARKYMVSGFSELREALGVTYEMHAAAYIEVLLDEMGYHGARVGRRYLLHEGKALEINVFSEKPLVVGEVKTHIRNVESAKEEVEKLMERVEAVERQYGERPMLIVLSVGTAPREVVDYLRTESERRKFRLILGREIEEQLRI